MFRQFFLRFLLFSRVSSRGTQLCKCWWSKDRNNLTQILREILGWVYKICTTLHLNTVIVILSVKFIFNFVFCLALWQISYSQVSVERESATITSIECTKRTISLNETVRSQTAELIKKSAPLFTLIHNIMCIINSISQCINITVSFKTALLYMFNFLFPVQSEPLYVPVKFQDVPAEHSNCLMGDCESCKYTEWRIQMGDVSLLPLIVQKLSQKISWTWALTSWELILSPLWEIQQVCFSADFTKGNYPQFIVL